MSNVPWLWSGSVVTRVVDGDSFTARVTRDLGFHGTATFDVKLRLNRVNAPPANTTMGQQSTALLRSLLSQGNNTSVLVLIETVKPYKYGDEWMAEVTLPDGSNLADLMVVQGAAVYWDGTGPRPGG